jgi:hypothetical protein
LLGLYVSDFGVIWSEYSLFLSSILSNGIAMQLQNVSLDYFKLPLAFMVVEYNDSFSDEGSELLEYLTGNGIFRIIVYCLYE